MVGEFCFHWLLMLSGKSTRSTEINVLINIIILTSCMYRFQRLERACPCKPCHWICALQYGKFRALSASSFPFCHTRERVLINMSPVILVHFGSHFSTVHFGWYFSTLHFVGRILVHLELHFGSFLIGYFLYEKVSVHSSFLTPHLQSFFFIFKVGSFF